MPVACGGEGLRPDSLSRAVLERTEGRSRLAPSEAARRLLTETRRADRGLRWDKSASIRPLCFDVQSRLGHVAEAAAYLLGQEGVVELAEGVRRVGEHSDERFAVSVVEFNTFVIGGAGRSSTAAFV
jgi:hypothetical protein